MNDKIEIYGVKTVQEDGEAGTVWEFTCPKCGTEMQDASSAWWECKCKCGYHWKVTLVAIGEK